MTSFSTREILASRNSWGEMSRAQRWLRRGMCRLINTIQCLSIIVIERMRRENSSRAQRDDISR